MDTFWSGKKVLVTGATGLVGTWLIRSLIKKKAHVKAFIRDPNPQSEFYRSNY
jgi:CDP-glucose 4,6-dehydratase